jgi:orotidine-5'-phosphate decarboxylase
LAAGSEKIIVALDTPRVDQAAAWVRELGGSVGAFKVGLEFIHQAGPEGVRAVQVAGASRLFFDGKFSDIPNTVAGAVRSTCALRPWLLNLHAMCGAEAMRAAARAAVEWSAQHGEQRPRIIAVTVLTSLSADALSAIGVAGSVEEEVVRLARLARECGLDGVVASPLEIRAIRQACGPEFLIVTPGVRPRGAETHDQSRVATPGDAVRAGADYVVVGRAITGALDPREAAHAIAAEIAAVGERQPAGVE